MSHPDVSQLNAEQLRALTASLFSRLAEQEKTLQQRTERNDSLTHRVSYLETLNKKLTHEMALLKRHRFGKHSEQLNVLQRTLLEDIVDADVGGIEAELEAAQADSLSQSRPKQQPKRVPLPPELPRRLIEHEPDNTHCQCGCQLQRIGEDISEKLDYTPGEFTVERHVRGKWVCKDCETLVQAPVPAHVIDKGLPTTGLLAQVLVAKYADHLPLYRQEWIFERAGLGIPRSTLAEWVGRCGVALQPLADALRETILSHPVVHADETPVPMLSPGKKKTHRAYIWAYCTTPYAQTRAVVYDFAPSRAGEHARTFLGDWQGKLVCESPRVYRRV
ncbi:MAG: IS66 family transposase [Pseudomonadales bacterium]|nr:IS66 family transposase [Pseudomonadales bacterium]